jgi:ElaA protein
VGTTPTRIEQAAGDELGVARLYDILALRSRVFVVEQSCHYQDLDGRDLDPSTVHLWVDDGSGTLAAYLRILDEGDHAKIGRVVTAPEQRRHGLGRSLVETALAMTPRPVLLSAQSQLTGWYESFGFVVDGPEYLDAGLPHTPMRLA